MQDKYGRKITYLRISLTDKCNCHCRYCRPLKNDDSLIVNKLSDEELALCIKAAVDIGINKIRLTGGEPLLRDDIIDIIRKIKNIDGVEEICITTNGILLPKYAAELKKAGANRINISIDSLNKDKYNYITGGANLDNALKGLYAALETGFDKIKINTVLIGNFNEDEVVDFAKLTLDQPLDVRFIELMPMYDSGDFNENSFIPCSTVLDKLNEANIHFSELPHNSGVARLYKIENSKGKIGLISPVSNHFCSECNRIRITSDGKLKPCLHSSDEISIKNLDYENIKKKLCDTILSKPKEHDKLSYRERSKSGRNMNQIGG